MTTTHSMSPPSNSSSARLWSPGRLGLLGLLAVTIVWSYFPTLQELAELWEREPDYSHGYLVLPLFAAFLWIRRDTFPHNLRPSWWGLVAIGASIGVRYLGQKYFLTPLDGWSLVLGFMGIALSLGGWRLFRWGLAPTLFLMFMVPLPYRLEFLISVPLQRIAATVSSFLLQCLGQPAFAEGTTILMDDQILTVEQSCSGLRIFVGIFALASAYLIAFRKEIWEGVLLMVAVVPVALIANAIRIVVTALLFRHISDEAAQHFSHDVAGWLMIPVAATLLGGVQWYLGSLMQDKHSEQMKELMQRPTPQPTS